MTMTYPVSGFILDITIIIIANGIEAVSLKKRSSFGMDMITVLTALFPGLCNLSSTSPLSSPLSQSFLTPHL